MYVFCRSSASRSPESRSLWAESARLRNSPSEVHLNFLLSSRNSGLLDRMNSSVAMYSSKRSGRYPPFLSRRKRITSSITSWGASSRYLVMTRRIPSFPMVPRYSAVPMSPNPYSTFLYFCAIRLSWASSAPRCPSASVSSGWNAPP